MTTAVFAFAAFVASVVGLSIWLRRRDRHGYPSGSDYGEEKHPEPGVHYRPLESPPSPPFD